MREHTLAEEVVSSRIQLLGALKETRSLLGAKGTATTLVIENEGCQFTLIVCFYRLRRVVVL